MALLVLAGWLDSRGMVVHLLLLAVRAAATRAEGAVGAIGTQTDSQPPHSVTILSLAQGLSHSLTWSLPPSLPTSLVS